MFRRRRRDTNADEQPTPAAPAEPAAAAEEAYEPSDAELLAADYEAEEADAGAAAGADDEVEDNSYDDALNYSDADDTGKPDERAGTRPQRADLSDPETWTRLRDDQSADRAATSTAGPWDSGSNYPDQARVDFGSLLIPVREGYEIQAMLSDEEGISVAVVHGDSAIQLQPFAAPRNSGLWPEVRPEIAQEVARAGGQSAERDGPFGPELVARVTPQGAGTEVPAQPLRFIGVDGPRWFLRGLVSGPAAMDDDLVGEFRDILADVVVVRGEHALPPRQPLQIQLPEEARQAAESQAQE
ncbi:MAG: DUF3710 domain-containing protein, partial [Actinobacteria bacterium]|nr:DUF3710 domain-containing protein [Actinomycetota bacterium]